MADKESRSDGKDKTKLVYTVPRLIEMKSYSAAIAQGCEIGLSYIPPIQCDGAGATGWS